MSANAASFIDTQRRRLAILSSQLVCAGPSVGQQEGIGRAARQVKMAAVCPYGRASLCFPMSVPTRAMLGAVESAEGLPAIAAKVAGYTTAKTHAAGAASLRLTFNAGDPGLPDDGAHLMVLRAPGREGWLVAVAGTRQAEEDLPPAVETVIFGRPDNKFQNVMYLPEATLVDLFPEGCDAEVRFLRFLLPVQHDCPEQWLRDRLLRLAAMLEDGYSDAPSMPAAAVAAALHCAGLEFGNAEQLALPADHGDRISQEELGYWDEEMKLNTRCGATMDGQNRLDYFMSHLPA